MKKYNTPGWAEFKKICKPISDKEIKETKTTKKNKVISNCMSKLMSDLTIELLILARDFHTLNKKQQIKAINETADKVFKIFNKNLTNKL